MVLEDRPMTFFEHLDELRSRLVKAFVAFMVAFFFVLVVHIDWQVYAGIPFPVPSLIDITGTASPSVSSQLLTWLLVFLTPPGVMIVTLEPQEYFVEVLKVGIFLAIVISMPIIIYEIGRFVAPGMRASERWIVARVAGPAALLFVLGVLFGFFLILPFTFAFLYGLVPNTISRQLRVDSFLDFILPFLVGFGLAFELPIIMVGLTYLGVVKPEFWKKHWRIAILICFVFGAVITPDGTGITMTLVAVPMMGLYGAGYAISRTRAANRRTKPS